MTSTRIELSTPHETGDKTPARNAHAHTLSHARRDEQADRVLTTGRHACRCRVVTAPRSFSAVLSESSANLSWRREARHRPHRCLPLQASRGRQRGSRRHAARFPCSSAQDQLDASDRYGTVSRTSTTGPSLRSEGNTDLCDRGGVARPVRIASVHEHHTASRQQPRARTGLARRAHEQNKEAPEQARTRVADSGRDARIAPTQILRARATTHGRHTRKPRRHAGGRRQLMHHQATRSAHDRSGIAAESELVSQARKTTRRTTRSKPPGPRSAARTSRDSRAKERKRRRQQVLRRSQARDQRRLQDSEWQRRRRHQTRDAQSRHA